MKDVTSAGPATFEDLSKRFIDLKRILSEQFLEATPSMRNLNALNIPETLSKTVDFQETLVRTSLEMQSLALEMSAAAQLQMWERYFQTLRQAQMPKS